MGCLIGKVTASSKAIELGRERSAPEDRRHHCRAGDNGRSKPVWNIAAKNRRVPAGYQLITFAV